MTDKPEQKDVAKPEHNPVHEAPLINLKAITPIGRWKLLALVLGILLIVSIWTSGFSGIISPSSSSGSVISGNSKASIILLSDKRCADCSTANIEKQIAQSFPNVPVNRLDYGTKEGKAIYESAGLAVLPAVLLTQAMKENAGYANVSKYIETKGEYLSLKVGSKFNPEAEICNNKIDDTGDGKVDCADPQCSGDMSCREETKGRLDVFVMSQCPFGVKGLDAMKEVLKNFGSDIDFHINYIVTVNADGTFKSLHGQAETDENIRELCAIKYYPDNYKYMDYIWERNKDIRNTTWEPAAKAAGIDAAVIKKCSEGDEGRKLLTENAAYTKSLGITASPTWIANNIKKFSGVAADAIKTSFCSVNSGLKGCGNTLSASTTVQGSCN